MSRVTEPREFVFNARIAVSGCDTAEEAIQILNNALLEHIDGHLLAAQRQVSVRSIVEARPPIHPDTGI